MRLAVVSDIHGNFHALEAVLSDISRRGADRIVCLGDVVSGPFDPAGTADLVMGLGLLTIRGNHDRWLIECDEDALDLPDIFARRALSPRHLDWLAALPATARIEPDIFLCHGTPASDMRAWLEHAPRKETGRLSDEGQVLDAAGAVEATMLLCGHTHVPRMVRLADGRVIVNPGAVGFHFELGAPDARYAIVEREPSGWTTELRTVAYDFVAAGRLAEANGFPLWRRVIESGWLSSAGLFTRSHAVTA